MAVEYWKASDEIHQQAYGLIGQYHPDLALVIDEIIIVFREKAGKSGGSVTLGTSKKVAPIANAIGATDFKFVLELAADVWEHELTSKQREALLDHLLMACRCEEDPKSGDLKCSVAKPDIMAFRENVERYGMWFPSDEEDTGPSPVEEMFGEEDSAENEVPATATTPERKIAKAPEESVDALLDDLMEDGVSSDVEVSPLPDGTHETV
tara:strand:- start:9180 stop:9806 length:627 start_codon:yes stop_codon:yes gene_type:complete